MPLSGVDDLCAEFRGLRDGKDCTFNVVVKVSEARGLKGLGNTGLNECRAKVFGSWDAEGYELSKVHTKTSTPFFEYVSKFTYKGQPRAFFESVLVIEMQHDRGLMPGKLIGLLQVGIIDIFHSRDHKIPTQWFAVSDIFSEEPAIPTGYIRCSLIINTMDETGAVQPDVPEEERGRCELLEIPRMHTTVTATGIYNIIFKIFQARDLTPGSFNSADPYLKIVTATGENQTDTKYDLNPEWNQQLQIPMYEPHFRQMIEVQLWNADGGVTGDRLVARFCLSWKDIFSQQDYFNKPRWYDMYALPPVEGFRGAVAAAGSKIKSVTRTVGNVIKNKSLVNAVSGMAFGSGSYEEATKYCGRVLMAIEIEDREGSKAPPSLAVTDMKPKDCKLFQDIKQKLFFRFHVFHAHGLNAAQAQVELTIGRKTIKTQPKGLKDTPYGQMFEFFEAMELEDDYIYDDKMWPWQNDDYEEGLFPSDLIDCAVPVCWLRVFRTDAVSEAVGLGLSGLTRRLIGFKKMTLRELLGIGNREASPSAESNCARPVFMELSQDNNDKGNVIFNTKENSLPSFFVPQSSEASTAFNPSVSGFKASPEAPPWPMIDDRRGNTSSMDPYKGMRCVALERDGACHLGDFEHAGFVWVSLKLYAPSRSNCATPSRGGPPILSPFSKYNNIPIPKPLQLKCTEYFVLRVHIYQVETPPLFPHPSCTGALYTRIYVNAHINPLLFPHPSCTWAHLHWSKEPLPPLETTEKRKPPEGGGILSIKPVHVHICICTYMYMHI